MLRGSKRIVAVVVIRLTAALSSQYQQSGCRNDHPGNRVPRSVNAVLLSISHTVHALHLDADVVSLSESSRPPALHSHFAQLPYLPSDQPSIPLTFALYPAAEDP